MGKYLPHVTFGTSDGDLYTGTLPTSIPGARLPVTQDSLALGLRYDVDDSVALKFEYQIVDIEAATGDGFGSIDENLITSGSVESYNVISVAMDVIF